MMRDITKLMVKDFRLMKLGYDFMGYKIDRKESLSFHHLIVPRRDCQAKGLGEGYLYWNGAILTQGSGFGESNSHDYLHLIEHIDPEIFYRISSELIDENIKGRIDIDNLRHIRDLLLYFEKEHDRDVNKKGKILIKKEYIDKRIIL